jgi:pyruvate-formate lyase-activating enzyme
LQRSGIDYEFRTTIVPGLNDSKKDIIQICKLIAPFIRDKNYILQQFRPDKGTLHPAYERVAPPSLDSLLKLKKVADKYLGNVIIRCKESMG